MIDLRGIEDSLAVDAFLDQFVKTQLLLPLFAWLPFLAWGPLGVVVTFIVTRFTGKIFDKLKVFVGNKFIAIARDGLKENLDHAGAELAVIALEKGIESEEFKNARQRHKDALSKFGRFGKP